MTKQHIRDRFEAIDHGVLFLEIFLKKNSTQHSILEMFVIPKESYMSLSLFIKQTFENSGNDWYIIN